jgi:pimeloyl-ACP methyl ester carboxylesterase
VPADGLRELDRRSVDLGRTRLEYWHRAAQTDIGADSVLFLHPWRGCWQFWIQTLLRMPEYECLAVDLYSPGRGEWDGFASPDGLALATTALLDERGIERCTVVGNSMGGFVAQILAAKLPERVGLLVLIGIGARSNRSAAYADNVRWLLAPPNLEATRQRVIQLFSRAPDAAELKVYVDAVMSADRDFFMAAMSNATGLDLRPRLHEIRARTLVLRGELDPIAAPTGPAELLDGIRESESMELAGAGHSPQVDSPDDFTRILRRFLEGEGGHVEGAVRRRSG